MDLADLLVRFRDIITDCLAAEVDSNGMLSRRNMDHRRRFREQGRVGSEVVDSKCGRHDDDPEWFDVSLWILTPSFLTEFGNS